MKALLLAVALAAPPALAADSPPAIAVEDATAPAVQLTARLVLQVPSAEEAADALVEAAQRRGGWFARRSRDAVTLRVPTLHARGFLEEAEARGKVLERSLDKTDRSEERSDLLARIEARQSTLAMYEDVLRGAPARSVVDVQRSVLSAIERLEEQLGKLRVLDDALSFARVDIAFRFPDRRAPRRERSPFPWVNTLDVADLVQRFEHPMGRVRVSAVAPEGFAPWPKPRPFLAVSPDAVRYRLREARHDPEADLAFWRDAVRSRQEQNGYRVVGEEALDAPVPGVLFELVAPFGPEDWTYLVAVFPHGRRVVIAEAAGRSPDVVGRRDAIVGAMRSWRP